MDRRLWKPLTVLVCVAGAVFALAEGHLLSPATPSGGAATITPGDAAHGAAVFATTCAGCHGQGGAGGGIGPRLAGTGISAALIQDRIEHGAGAMPAGLVKGTNEADVLAYVLGISASK
jgi:mono/diheme cytochrome c family protein